MIKEYRKKPLVIEAIKWEGVLTEEVMDFVGVENLGGQEFNFKIKTLEGYVNVSEGDYIIKGVKGEFYPCKPDIFEMTYDEAYVRVTGDFGGKRYGAELLDNARLMRSILSLEVGKKVCVSSYSKDVILKIENIVRRENNG